MTKVIIFIGPPGSGKDMLAYHLKSVVKDSTIRSFKDELLNDAYDLLQEIGDHPDCQKKQIISKSMFNALCKDRHSKDEPHILVSSNMVRKLLTDVGCSKDWSPGGYPPAVSRRMGPMVICSPRQWLIFTSEYIMKNRHGLSRYGDLLKAEVDASGASYVFVPDGGFPEELFALSKYYPVHVVSLVRPGTTFAGDSRSYILDPKNTEVVNEFLSHQEKFWDTSSRAMSYFINGGYCEYQAMERIVEHLLDAGVIDAGDITK